MREVVVAGTDRTLASGEEIDLPWKELPARLAEAAVTRLIAALGEDRLETLWCWPSPLLEALPAAGTGEEPGA
jgi:hypothetical protein